MDTSRKSVDSGPIRRPPAESTLQSPDVAIVMRSKNEQPHTERTLAGLSAQRYRNFAVHVVDSGSTDNTIEVLKQYPELVGSLVEIAPDEYIPGRVLNRMIGQTKEPIVVLLNADCVPTDASWLEELLRPILEDTADAVSARQVARPDARFIVKRDLDRAYGSTDPRGKSAPFFSAAACAFKRTLWEEEKFPEEGWGEDFVWAVRCKQRGARFVISTKAVVEHSHNYTLKTLFRREFGHGMVYYQVLKAKPSLSWQVLASLKHIVRDGLDAVIEGEVRTIPYNFLYRLTFDWAQYRGRRAGYREEGFPNVFFRE